MNYKELYDNKLDFNRLNELSLNLKEMPYVDLNKGNNSIDLEFEKYSSPKEIIKVIQDILNGQEHIDKYGNKILLSKGDMKKEFAKNLFTDIIFNNIVKNKFNPTERSEINYLLSKYFA